MGADAGYDPDHLRGAKEYAQQLDLHKNVIGRYEQDQAEPSIDVAAKIAKFLGVSLDYLSGNIEADIADRVLSIQKLPVQEKELTTRTIDALARDATARHAYVIS